MAEVTSIIQNSISPIAFKLIVLLLTMSMFVAVTLVITGLIKVPWGLRKGLAAMSALIGAIVWIELIYVKLN